MDIYKWLPTCVCYGGMVYPENTKTWKYQIQIFREKMPNLKNKYQD